MILYHVMFKDSNGTINGLTQAFKSEDNMYDFLEENIGVKGGDIISIEILEYIK